MVKEIVAEEEFSDFRLKRDSLPYLKFTGKHIGHAYCRELSTGVDGQLDLYQTRGGKYVCHKITETRWIGHTDTHAGKICDDISGVFDFFGHGELAQELYADAGLDDSEEVG